MQYKLNLCTLSSARSWQEKANASTPSTGSYWVFTLRASWKTFFYETIKYKYKFRWNLNPRERQRLLLLLYFFPSIWSWSYTLMNICRDCILRNKPSLFLFIGNTKKRKNFKKKYPLLLPEFTCQRFFLHFFGTTNKACWYYVVFKQDHYTYSWIDWFGMCRCRQSSYCITAIPDIRASCGL